MMTVSHLADWIYDTVVNNLEIKHGVYYISKDFVGFVLGSINFNYFPKK